MPGWESMIINQIRRIIRFQKSKCLATHITVEKSTVCVFKNIRNYWHLPALWIFHKKIDAQNRVDNIAARKALINQGVKFIKLSEKEKTEWEKIDDVVIDEMLTKYKYNKALYKAVTIHKHDAPEFH